MEEKRFVIRPRLERKLLEDLVALHSKVGKDTDTKINRIANAVLLIAGIVLLVCSAVLFWLDGVSGTSVLSLALGVFAVVWFALRGRIAARRMQRSSEKYAQNQVITLDDAGIRVESTAALTAYRYDAVEAIYRWQRDYSDTVSRIAADMGVRMIDLRRFFLRDGHSPEELLCDDGIHPSRIGQGLIFDAFSAAL